ncbi:polysaccharide deacetylase family protein [Propionivibrio sp.]|uniref:polysaccharide deacetylase family protein n=1 Tax=Propionivibrio sp. TaxID=2212460 RepID=UPI00261F0F4A|nr:polysaccharide deacetylase family protein [Propionivibrio sp.]
MTASALPILMYHHVSPAPGLVTVTPKNFVAQMAWLAANDYHTASCADLEGFLQGRPLPQRTVMITFDDGYLDNYVHAFPILRQYGLHAVIFAVTDWIGDGAARPHPVAGESGAPLLLNHNACTERIREGRADEAIVRWSEVECMRAAGSFEFQSHTASHTRWDKISGNAAEKSTALGRDLERSRETLRQRLGMLGTHLCWPQGYFDADYLSVARDQGFTHLYTTTPGSLRPDGDANKLPRIVVKDKGAAWFSSRIHLYSSPFLARWYGRLKGI